VILGLLPLALHFCCVLGRAKCSPLTTLISRYSGTLPVRENQYCFQQWPLLWASKLPLVVFLLEVKESQSQGHVPSMSLHSYTLSTFQGPGIPEWPKPLSGLM
jgi:hypothetical protein